MTGNHYKGHEVSCCIKYFIFGFNIIFWVCAFLLPLSRVKSHHCISRFSGFIFCHTIMVICLHSCLRFDRLLISTLIESNGLEIQVLLVTAIDVNIAGETIIIGTVQLQGLQAFEVIIALLP